MRDTIEFVEYLNNGEEEIIHQLPGRWKICSNCQGCGTDRGASVECDGGGFTASEWAEQDDEFKEDYLNGYYDKPCAYCSGSGKKLVVDRKQCDKELLKKYLSYLQEEAEYQSMCYYERRMGA